MYKQCTTSRSIARQKQVASNMLEMMVKVPYSKVTVSSLCETSHISRNVFYKYFDSTEAVFEFICDDVRYDLEQDVFNRENASFYEEALRFFRYWNAHRQTLVVLVKNNLLEPLFTSFVQNTNIRRMSIDQMTNEIPRELFPLVAQCTAYGLGSMLVVWNKENFQSSPEQLAEIASRILTTPFYKSIKGDSY